MDNKEIERIAREFDFKNYQTRYKTDIDIVLGALMGA